MPGGGLGSIGLIQRSVWKQGCEGKTYGTHC